MPDAKVLATGDLVVNPFPYGTGSFYGEWLTTLRKRAAIDAQTIVPGHGALERDQTYLLRLPRLLETVQTEVAASVHEELSIEETQKRVTLADAKSDFCAGREFQSWCENCFDNNYVGPAIARSYKEEKDGPLVSED